MIDIIAHQFLDSIVVSISACHAEDRGSIPRRGGAIFAITTFTNAIVIDPFRQNGFSADILSTILLSHWTLHF